MEHYSGVFYPDRTFDLGHKLTTPLNQSSHEITSERPETMKPKRSALNLHTLNTESEKIDLEDGSYATEQTHYKGEMIFHKYSVFWRSGPNSDDLGVPQEIVLDLPNNITIEKTIELSIHYFNIKLRGNNTDYLLRNDPSLFHLFCAKKNGKPKEDYPPFDRRQVLSKTHVKHLVLVEVGEDSFDFPRRKSEPSVNFAAGGAKETGIYNYTSPYQSTKGSMASDSNPTNNGPEADDMIYGEDNTTWWERLFCIPYWRALFAPKNKDKNFPLDIEEIDGYRDEDTSYMNKSTRQQPLLASSHNTTRPVAMD